MFEKPKTKVLEGQDDEPLAIYMIYLDQESRLLALAGGTHVMLFKFSKQEGTLEVPVCWTIHRSIPVYYCYKFNYPLTWYTVKPRFKTTPKLRPLHY